MYISRKKSQIIAIGILVTFFLGSVLYIHFSATSTATQEAFTSFEDEQATDLVPEPSTESATTPAALPSSASSPADAAAEPAPQQESSFALKEFHRSETRDGKTLWEIRGERARYSPESKSVVIQKCRLLYLTKDDKTITITSETANLSLLGTEVQRAVFEGDVVIVHDSGTTIRTDTAEYFKQENKIQAPGTVRIEGSWYETTGVGLQGDLAKNEFTLLDQVKSKLDPAKRDKD